MAKSREYREWHLTPSGWVMGTDKTDTTTDEVEPPSDRVLTVQCGTVLRASDFANWEIFKREIWRAPGQDDLIAELIQKFGDRESGYPG